MVRQSDLAFRQLCRRHGCDAAYTEMMMADAFASDAAYRAQRFRSSSVDRPLIAQFAANCPATLLAAASHIRHCVDCLDINLGCPQQSAKDGRYGAYLLDRAHWPLVRAMVESLLPLGLPVSVKIRLLPSLPLTLEFLSLLVSAGVSMIAVHGRQRGSCRRRRQGSANMGWLTACVQHVKALSPAVSVIVNGNTRCHADLLHNLAVTGADGVMAAEALLANPLLFSDTAVQLHPFLLPFLPPLLRSAAALPCQHRISAVGACRLYLQAVEESGGEELGCVAAHLWQMLRTSAAYDAEVQLQVKDALRRRLQSVHEIRLWLDDWEQEQQRELDDRLSTGRGMPFIVKSGDSKGRRREQETEVEEQSCRWELGNELELMQATELLRTRPLGCSGCS